MNLYKADFKIILITTELQTFMVLIQRMELELFLGNPQNLNNGISYSLKGLCNINSKQFILIIRIIALTKYPIVVMKTLTKKCNKLNHVFGTYNK